jgi:hypothetical protein
LSALLAIRETVNPPALAARIAVGLAHRLRFEPVNGGILGLQARRITSAQKVEKFCIFPPMGLKIRTHNTLVRNIDS